MSEEQTNFKVTDRRLFNSDGSPRELSPEEKKAQESAAVEANATAKKASGQAPAAVTAAAEPAPATDKTEASSPAAAESPLPEEVLEDAIPDADDPASFVNFAMSIASNAAAALGMMEHPVTHKREVDLELGKHWIDVLGMLQKKMRGNLSPPEEQILEGWLADLRMQYVSLTSAAPKTAPAFTGRDIIGGK
jgi:hypothetical protein